MKISKLALVLAGLALAASPAAAQKLTFTLNWVAGGDHAPYFYAQKMGWYKQAGIDIDFETGRGSAASAQKVGAGASQLGLSDMAGVLLFRGKGLDLVGLMNVYANSPQGLYWLKSNGINSIKDLAGKKIGVSAPGSSTNFFVNALIARDGVKPDEVSIIGVGTGLSAVAAVKKGEIDAIVNLDPVMTKLDQDGEIVILADSRTDEGNMKLFGGNNPAAVVYLKHDFIEKNPNTVQALVNAFYKTLKWLERATPEEIAATVPEDYYLGDKPLYMAAVKANRPVYSLTGVIPAAGMTSASDMLVAFDPELKDAKIDLAKTFDDRFVQKAAAGK